MKTVIPGEGFYRTWTKTQKDACREWLRANGLDPDEIACRDIDVHVMDCPAITYDVFVRDPDTGRILLDHVGDVRIERRTTALRVALPDPRTFPIIIDTEVRG